MASHSRSTMAAKGLVKEERVGLALAVAAHVGLVALLVWRPPSPAVVAPPERMTVSISDEVGLTSTSPEPAAQPAAETAPEIGQPSPPQPEPLPVARPEPLPRPQPQPRPAARVEPRPAPQPVARATPRPAPRASTPARPIPKKAGSSRFDEAFKNGIPGAAATGASRNPPAAISGAARASLASAISRELKPRWVAPQGAEAEKLVTILTWNLNRDGSLAGQPRVVRQDGITDANRPQAARHAEQAIRAVQLAAPFDLPEEFYDAWKRVAQFRFDRRLSQ